MEVQILVKVNISFDDGSPDFESGDPGEDRMRESAGEAVKNALEFVGDEMGFTHGMDGVASVGLVDCDVLETAHKSMKQEPNSEAAGTVQTTDSPAVVQKRLVVPSGRDVLAKREPYTADDLIDAVLACAEEELQGRLSGLENGFDHPNACVLFGFAKGIAISLRHNDKITHGMKGAKNERA